MAEMIVVQRVSSEMKLSSNVQHASWRNQWKLRTILSQAYFSLLTLGQKLHLVIFCWVLLLACVTWKPPRYQPTVEMDVFNSYRSGPKQMYVFLGLYSTPCLHFNSQYLLYIYLFSLHIFHCDDGSKQQVNKTLLLFPSGSPPSSLPAGV